jgi:hypothetical protein
VNPDRRSLRPIPSKPDPWEERYPELSQFFGCNFHQDWDIEAEDDEGLVRLFRNSAQDAHVADARKELDAFLAEELTEDELGTILLGSFYCYYDPSYFGFTNRQWLERIRGFLAER